MGREDPAVLFLRSSYGMSDHPEPARAALEAIRREAAAIDLVLLATSGLHRDVQRVRHIRDLCRCGLGE